VVPIKAAALATMAFSSASIFRSKRAAITMKDS
jgi:hypothetical protein